MADPVSYLQLLEQGKQIDYLLESTELSEEEKNDLEYVWKSLKSREGSKFDAIIGVIVTGADGAATDQSGTGQIEFKDGAAVEGDQVELICDGNKWYALGHCNAATGIDMNT